MRMEKAVEMKDCSLSGYRVEIRQRHIQQRGERDSDQIHNCDNPEEILDEGGSREVAHDLDMVACLLGGEALRLA